MKYNGKNKDAVNMRLLDKEEEDDDLMLTVTLIHAAKRHKKEPILDIFYFWGEIWLILSFDKGTKSL